MPPNWTLLPGLLARGYRVASGPSRDYPYGALDRQRPLFKARGLDLDGYFNGTLSPTRPLGTLSGAHLQVPQIRRSNID